VKREISLFTIGDENSEYHTGYMNFYLYATASRGKHTQRLHLECNVLDICRGIFRCQNKPFYSRGQKNESI